MNLKKILTLLAAAAAIVTAAVVCVVAAACALHAVALAYLHPAAAAAVVAVAFVAVIAGIVLALTHKPGQRRAPAPPPEPALTDRLIQLARERPIVAGAGAIAAAIFVARNPKIMNIVLSAALATKAARTPPNSR